MKKLKNQPKTKSKATFWSKHKTKTILVIVILTLFLWSAINIITSIPSESQTTPKLDTPSQAQVAITITSPPESETTAQNK